MAEMRSVIGKTDRGRVAVVGAGVSGLACAERLVGAGFDVRVFEKSRGVSGRMSTRRLDSGLAFDHGAQYFTARDPAFSDRVEQWIADGVVAEWHGKIVDLRQGQATPRRDGKRRFVGTPDMPAPCRRLAADLPVKLNTRVTHAARVGAKWAIKSDAGEALGTFDQLLITVPAPQSATLLGDAGSLKRSCEQVKMQGCWAVMAAFEEPLATGYEGAFVHDSLLAWVARSSSKPGRPAGADAWVLHAGHDWSDRHIEARPELAEAELLDAFWQATGIPPRPARYQTAHRWRFAIPCEPLAERCLYDASLGVGVAGDWCGGPRVEGAFLSGLALADAVRSA